MGPKRGLSQKANNDLNISKGYAWCKLILFAPNDLEKVFKRILSDSNYLLKYNRDESVLWKFNDNLKNDIIPSIVKIYTDRIKNPV